MITPIRALLLQILINVYLTMCMGTTTPTETYYKAALDATNTKNLKEILSNNDIAIETAKNFLTTSCPDFLTIIQTHKDQKSSNDRLVKIGRLIAATIIHQTTKNEDEKKTNAILTRLVKECTTMTKVLDTQTKIQIPKVRFGKTELEMPILTLGCMRFQQSWNRGGRTVKQMEDVDEDCQQNLVEIIRYAVSRGVNHIETAMGYGSSELQMGEALQTLFQEGEFRREDLILQTKGGISESTTPEGFRSSILQQIQRLKVDYVDLFSLHGMNTLDQIDWLYDKHLMGVLKQLKKEGKVRNIGFSTHAPAEVTSILISKGDFDYLNLHHHFCGDYTASGDGDNGGNIDNVRLAHEKDMGIFIISPYDKGGRLYAPSNKLRALTLPEFEPIEFGSLWLWHHDRIDTQGSKPHTIVCGAARPSDLDQSIYAALNAFDSQTASDVDVVADRLKNAMVQELGQDWVDTWHHGVPNHSNSQYGTQMGNIVWLSNVIRAYGLLDFAKERYAPMENSLKVWDYQKTYHENIKSMSPMWPWVPGCAYDAEKVDDYMDDLKKVLPTGNKKKVLEALEMVHKYCGKSEMCEDVPFDWETAYDMRPWTAFPER